MIQDSHMMIRNAGNSDLWLAFSFSLYNLDMDKITIIQQETANDGIVNKMVWRKS